MPVNASIGHGSSFQRSSDGTSTGTFTAIGEVMSISPPNLSRETVDATHMASTDGWREFIAGLKDGGEVSIQCNFDPNGTDVSNWLADINDEDPGYYKVIFPDTTSWGFAALMTGLEIEDPLDDKMVATATYKVSGKPAFVS
jgi:predicted secreted protein